MLPWSYPPALNENDGKLNFWIQNDGISRREDTIIAWTWKRFYNDTLLGIQEPELLLRFPMCKVCQKKHADVIAEGCMFVGY